VALVSTSCRGWLLARAPGVAPAPPPRRALPPRRSRGGDARPPGRPQLRAAALTGWARHRGGAGPRSAPGRWRAWRNPHSREGQRSSSPTPGGRRCAPRCASLPNGAASPPRIPRPVAHPRPPSPGGRARRVRPSLQRPSAAPLTRPASPVLVGRRAHDRWSTSTPGNHVAPTASEGRFASTGRWRDLHGGFRAPQVPARTGSLRGTLEV
jgi:hypothetical protein